MWLRRVFRRWIDAGQTPRILRHVGYQLIFWRQAADRLDPKSVYTDLMDGVRVAGLAELPVAAIVERIAELFDEGIDDDAAGFALAWVSSDEMSSLQIETSTQHVHVEMRPLDQDTANSIIGVLSEFDCPLYDPQIARRFAPGEWASPFRRRSPYLTNLVALGLGNPTHRDHAPRRFPSASVVARSRRYVRAERQQVRYQSEVSILRSRTARRHERYGQIDGWSSHRPSRMIVRPAISLGLFHACARRGVKTSGDQTPGLFRGFHPTRST